MKIFWFICLIFICIAAYLNLPMFGHLPDEISMAKIKKSPNCKNGKFSNLHATPQMTGKGGFFATMYDFYFGNHKDKIPDKALPAVKTDLKKLNKNEDLLVWFGHSSYYIQLHGVRYLVDPVFSNNASPIPHNVVPFEGTDIYSADDLPEIDYLIITHDHYDHLDYETVKKLRPKVKAVITGLGTGSHLRRWGYENNIIHEMDWNETFSTNDGEIVTLPARHFSGRSLFPNKSLWASYLINTPNYKIYLGGDSGYDDHYKTIGNKYKDIDLALLDAGQYDKNWRYIHAHPDEVLQAARDLGAKRIVPIHNSKFSICNHPWYEPLEKVTTRGENENFAVLTPKIGEVVRLSDKSQKFSRWWKL